MILFNIRILIETSGDYWYNDAGQNNRINEVLKCHQ